jgi:hypothetical protein
VTEWTGLGLGGILMQLEHYVLTVEKIYLSADEDFLSLSVHIEGGGLLTAMSLSLWL